MPSPGDELASIDFESMIGGPLSAVVRAQAQAAMTTVNFIKQVGFKQPATDQLPGSDTETEEPIYVTFKYKAEVPARPGDGTTPPTPGGEETRELSVPLLTMVPIPFIRIDLTTIDFNAKITSVEYHKTDDTLKLNSSLDAGGSWQYASAKFKVSTSYQRTTQQGNSVNRTYSMAVHVRAVQDEMPRGIEQVLSILEGAIMSKPAS